MSDPAGTCAECGRTSTQWVAYSHELGAEVCLGCHLEATRQALGTDEDDRIGRQHEIARSVRRAVEPLRGSRRWRMVRDRALLLETAKSSDEARELFSEIRALGVEIEGKPA